MNSQPYENGTHIFNRFYNLLEFAPYVIYSYDLLYSVYASLFTGAKTSKFMSNLLINVHLEQYLVKAVGLECAPAPTHCLHGPLEMKYLVAQNPQIIKLLVSKTAEMVHCCVKCIINKYW